MPKIIFFGSSSRGTPTKHIYPESITFFNLYKRIKKGIPSPVTNKEYWLGTSSQRKNWKATDFFTAAFFTGKNRNSGSVKNVHLVILDIDEHDAADHILKLFSITGVPSELQHLNMFLYDTTSSKKDALKVRLVIDVKPYDQIYHANVVYNIADILNVKFDPVSKVPCQLMYFPLAFEDYPLECVFYPSNKPTGIIRHFFEYEGKTPKEKEIGLASSIEPYARYSDEDILEAIKFLKVDHKDNERYEPRFRIAAAIKRQYIYDDAKGREILETYAARWTIEGSRDKIFDYYTRLKDSTGGETITILTLIAEAKENGWEQKHHWLDDFVYLKQVRNQYYNTQTREAINKGTFDLIYGYHLMDPNVPWEKQRNDLASIYATKIRRIPTYADVMFYPGARETFRLEKNGPKYLNTYIPIEVNHPPNHAAVQKTLQIMEKHIADIIGEPLLERLVISFLANAVQNPATPTQWALVLVSVPGTGKSIVYTWLSAIMGKHAKDPRWVDYISSQSDYLLDTQFLLLNEVLPGRRNATSLTESLKTIVEGKTAKVRIMYRNTFEVPSRLNIMLFSNSKKIITPKDDTRRYLYIESPMTTLEAKEKYKANGFKDAYELAQRPRDIVAALMSYPIYKGFDINAAYQTEAIERLRQDSHGNDAQIIQTFIDSDDYVGINTHLLSSLHLRKAYKGERERYISYKVDEALEELGYRKNRYKTKERDYRLNIPKSDTVKRCKLTTYNNVDSTKEQIETAEEDLKEHYKNNNSMT